LAEVSHFIDASFVYGSTVQQGESLRAKVLGRLKEKIINGRSFPPHNPDPGVCFSLKLEDLCMNAGEFSIKSENLYLNSSYSKCECLVPTRDDEEGPPC